MTAQKEVKTEWLPVFDNVVTEGQQFFRVLLKAMSEPGLIMDVGDLVQAYTSDHPGLSVAWPLAQSLTDEDCEIYVYPSLEHSALPESLTFHSGVQLVDTPTAADFIFLTLPEFQSIDDWNTGDIESPHGSSTAIILVDEISSDKGIQLSGPGIKQTRPLSISGLSASQIKLLKSNHQQYPCGIDFIFCTATKLVAIPRSTSIHAAMESC
jgi:alpha-D-ribose 1-methylphosphonate 5-triphosphate synthase subunit PhnH